MNQFDEEKELRAWVTELQQRIAELEKALRPFAIDTQNFGGRWRIARETLGMQPHPRESGT